jgi:hypothetical protein
MFGAAAMVVRGADAENNCPCPVVLRPSSSPK